MRIREVGRVCKRGRQALLDRLRIHHPRNDRAAARKDGDVVSKIRTYICISHYSEGRIPIFDCEDLSESEQEILFKLPRQDNGISFEVADDLCKTIPRDIVEEIRFESLLGRIENPDSAFAGERTLMELAKHYAELIRKRRRPPPDLTILADEIDTMRENGAPESAIDEHTALWNKSLELDPSSAPEILEEKQELSSTVTPTFSASMPVCVTSQSTTDAVECVISAIGRFWDGKRDGKSIDELVAELPPLGSHHWVKNKQAADNENVQTSTLKDYRARGSFAFTSLGQIGVDQDGRIWIKPSKNGHPLYFRRSLRNSR